MRVELIAQHLQLRGVRSVLRAQGGFLLFGQLPGKLDAEVQPAPGQEQIEHRQEVPQVAERIVRHAVVAEMEGEFREDIDGGLNERRDHQQHRRDADHARQRQRPKLPITEPQQARHGEARDRDDGRDDHVAQLGAFADHCGGVEDEIRRPTRNLQGPERRFALCQKGFCDDRSVHVARARVCRGAHYEPIRGRFEVHPVAGSGDAARARGQALRPTKT